MFTQLTRDRLSIFLTEHAGDCQVGGAAYFVVDDVDALYREISARGIRPTKRRKILPACGTCHGGVTRGLGAP